MLKSSLEKEQTYLTLTAGFNQLSLHEKNIFLVEKTYPVKHGFSQELAILVTTGFVGK